MKKLLTVLVLFGALSAGAYANKIAKVNSLKVFNEFSKTKTINKEIETEVEKIQKELKSKEEALLKERQELEKKGDALTDDEKKKFEDKVSAFQKYVKDSSDKISKKEEKALTEIKDLLSKAINEVAKDEKYDFILEADVVILGGIDITDKVQKKLETIKK